MEYIRAGLAILTEMTIDQFIITLLLVTVYLLYKKVQCLQHKYNQIDKLVFAHGLIINTKLGIRTVKMHRNNDYEVAQPINVTESQTLVNPANTQP